MLCSTTYPVSFETEKREIFSNRRERSYKWIEFVLPKIFTQFGPHVYRQSSGISMEFSPLPKFADFFAFKLARDGGHDHM